MADYQNAEEKLLAEGLFQVYYRLLGMFPLKFGLNQSVSAIQYLQENGYGGEVSWVVPGSIGQWDNVTVMPGLPDSPIMSMWFVGSRITQATTIFIRKGFWSLYIPNPVYAIKNRAWQESVPKLNVELPVFSGFLIDSIATARQMVRNRLFGGSPE